jgi:hypothetical protein
MGFSVEGLFGIGAFGYTGFSVVTPGDLGIPDKKYIFFKQFFFKKF